MIEHSATFLPIWMLLWAGFGFLAGEALGDCRRHRKCLDQANADLRDALEKDRTGGVLGRWRFDRIRRRKTWLDCCAQS